jgi:nitrate reductase gamma subunit
MYEFVSGPMVWLALVLFVVGLVVQAFRFAGQTHAKPREFQPQPPASPPSKKGAKKKASLYQRGVALYDGAVRWLGRSLFGTHPVMAVVTVTFHLLLILTPLLLLAHNLLIADSIGLALPSLPEGLSDFLTVVVLFCLAIFLLRRLFMRRLRAISSPYDFFVLLVTAAPFVTGFLAYHQWFDYRTVMLLHMLSGELMLILIPFTRLGHALFFFLYRFYLGSEYSFGQGKRAW